MAGTYLIPLAISHIEIRVPFSLSAQLLVNSAIPFKPKNSTSRGNDTAARSLPGISPPVAQIFTWLIVQKNSRDVWKKNGFCLRPARWWRPIRSLSLPPHGGATVIVFCLTRVCFYVGLFRCQPKSSRVVSFFFEWNCNPVRLPSSFNWVLFESLSLASDTSRKDACVSPN